MAVFIALTGITNKTLGTQWAGVVMVFLFQFLMGFGWMACPWLVSLHFPLSTREAADMIHQYGPEISPLKYRHIGGAAGAVGEWSMTFVTVFGGGIALQRTGYGIWFWQLASCILSAICKSRAVKLKP